MTMTLAIEMPVAAKPVCKTVRPPGSKSITNRALVCAALAKGQSRLSGVLDSQDTRAMVQGLRQLGFILESDWAHSFIDITGSSGTIPVRNATIHCEASGTTMRFLSAMCALGQGEFTLDGTHRMRQRPIGDLAAALESLGVQVTVSELQCPPITIRAIRSPHAETLFGGSCSVQSSVSSQFASGLAMIGPCTSHGLTIVFEGQRVSVPYLDMTRRVMESFGASVQCEEPTKWSIAATGYQGISYAIEPDASAASYFFAAAAITGGSVEVRGLSRVSMQGDVGFCDALEKMGVVVEWLPDAIRVSGPPRNGIDIDMNSISDTVPTLAVVAMFAPGPTTIRNVAHIRFKETDRISDLVRELQKLGVNVTETLDSIHIQPQTYRGTLLETYDDHRMAMSLSLAGLRIPGVHIKDPLCVCKTFPGYWTAISNLADLDTSAWPPSIMPNAPISD